MTGPSKDYELDRLKSERERAFNRMNDAWRKQNNAWENLKSLRARSGPKIDSLNAEQNELFISIGNYFERSKSSYGSKDYSSAKSYSEQGKDCKIRHSAVVEERRRLVAELRSEGDILKKASEEFKVAKEEFKKAKLNFQERLEIVKSQNQRKRDNKKEIARKAGVPSRYLNDIWISTKPDGTVNIYFGGVGKADGIGHGHYTMNRNGEVTYKREPFDPHGAQNFTKDKVVEYFAYDRHMRSDKLPIMSGSTNGIIYLHGEKAGQSVHFTQVYDDKYHVSWDAKPNGTVENVHWTNDALKPGDPAKFLPPSDARVY